VGLAQVSRTCRIAPAIASTATSSIEVPPMFDRLNAMRAFPAKVDHDGRTWTAGPAAEITG
jgi:hypothetical protein